MGAPFIVAKANTAGTTQGAQKKPVQVTKPSDGQAITVELSHDQPTKADLTAIAGENITLARIGERLIILFDNRSTVTIEPYFDSMNVASPNVTFELSPGRVVGATELATLFSITTTDQSVLPEDRKPGAPPAPAAGANFSDASVEPLDTPDPPEARPLPLLTPADVAAGMVIVDAEDFTGFAGLENGITTVSVLVTNDAGNTSMIL